MDKIDDFFVEVVGEVIFLVEGVIGSVVDLDEGELLFDVFLFFLFVILVCEVWYWNIILFILVGGELCSLLKVVLVFFWVGLFVVFLLLLFVLILVELVWCFGGGERDCWFKVCGCLNNVFDWIMILSSIWGWGLFRFRRNNFL